MTLSLGAEKETSEDGDTGQAVFVQDQTTEVIDLNLHRNLANVTLASKTALDDLTIDLEPGHGFTTGESICLLEGQVVSQFNVLNVVSDTITIDSPMDKIYTEAATAIRHTFDMRVDGSSTPQIYRIAPIPGQTWDITRVILVMESTANNMDFTEFGSLAALDNGCVLRKTDGVHKNMFNFKSNGEFINRSFDALFQTKTGGGGSGFSSRTTFGGQSRRGVVIRLDGNKGDEFQCVIQDAISAAGTLSKFFMIAQGHMVQK